MTRPNYYAFLEVTFFSQATIPYLILIFILEAISLAWSYSFSKSPRRKDSLVSDVWSPSFFSLFLAFLAIAHFLSLYSFLIVILDTEHSWLYLMFTIGNQTQSLTHATQALSRWDMFPALSSQLNSYCVFSRHLVRVFLSVEDQKRSRVDWEMDGMLMAEPEAGSGERKKCDRGQEVRLKSWLAPSSLT